VQEDRTNEKNHQKHKVAKVPHRLDNERKRVTAQTAAHPTVNIHQIAQGSVNKEIRADRSEAIGDERQQQVPQIIRNLGLSRAGKHHQH
jgi:hypothetical protein